MENRYFFKAKRVANGESKWIDDFVWRKDLHYWANVGIEKLEVVGNRFDNPELLEVQE